MRKQDNINYAQPVRQLEVTEELRRDIFAVAIMNCLVGRYETGKEAAKLAYEYADAMLEARKQ